MIAGTLPRARLVPILGALLLGTLMTSLSTLVLTTALPVVIAALGGLELYSWAFAAALLTSTIAYPIAGKLSDLYGRKRLYLIGMATFMLGSALCGTAQSIEQLIAFRALQGVGAGTVQPTVAALIADLFPLEQRGRWQGINGAIWGLSSVLGPIIGGVLAEHASWRWVFLVNIPPGLVAAGIMQRYLPGEILPREEEDGAFVSRSPESRGGTIDYVGMALLSGSLLVFLLTTLWGGQLLPWTSPPILALLALSSILLVAFVRHERRAAEPIVPLVLFENRSYQTTMMLLFLSGVGMYGGTTYVPLYLQAVFGISPTGSGLLFLPTAVVSGAASVVAGIYMHRIGYRRLAVLTMAASALGFGLVAAVSPEAGVWPAVTSISVVASAIGLSFPVFLIIAQETAPPTMRGVATSLVQLTRSLGGTLGVTLLGAYMAARLAPLLGGGAAGQRELAALLRPEALAALSPTDVAYLRAELAGALRAMFAAGAAMMALAAVLALRLEEIAVVERGRRGRRQEVRVMREE